MPDIRSFFSQGGGPASAPKKPEPKKADDAQSRRAKNRKVIEESDDEDFEPAPPKKPAATAAPKKKKADEESVSGVATSASDYFGSSKKMAPKGATPKKPQSKLQTEVEIRVSPRMKQPARQTAPTVAKNGKDAPKKAPIQSFKNVADDDDDYEDEDGGDDIFMADAKGLGKRKNGDYVEEDSEEEFLPKPKRVASKSRAAAMSDDEPIAKPAKGKKTTASPPSRKTSPPSKKRKTPEPDEFSEEDVEVSPKKPAAKKSRPPKAKKPAPVEDASLKAIFDSIPTIRPPTPPPKDPDAKPNWHKGAAAGGGAASMGGAIDLPEGADGCLAGLTFVFTGLLQTISREDGQALVKKYEGKVTTQPSKKTSYVVLGAEAGPAKLAKIRENGIKTIDEQGLFELIRRLPAYGGSGIGAEKAQQKKKEEQEMVRQQASQMEKEEKERKAAAEKAAKQAAAARGIAPVATPQTNTPSQLWTTKYAPTQLSHICGNKGNVEKIQSWLKNWHKSKRYDFQKRGADGMGGYRSLIISGPPGIGKTTAAHLAAKLEGYDILESNASDTRSKKLVENGISDVLNNTSLLGYFAGDGKKVEDGKKKIVLIMDEVDGMSAGDRGGVGALAKFCKKTQVPLILICNERRLPKMKPFDFVAGDIKFTRPTADQIRSRIMTICHREGLKLPPPVIDALVEGSGKDIRQIINMISTIKLDQTSMSFDQSKKMSQAWEKHVVLKPWDIIQKLLGGGLFSPASKATLNDKIELYFNDHEFSYLMMQENYLRSKPAALAGGHYSPREQNMKLLELMDKAAESISDGDLVDRMIHGAQQQWSLMPTHAVFSTVRPASFVAGMLMGSTFSTWLGNNSKTGKLSRFVKELHSHMRLKSSGDHNEIRQQYLPVLWTQLVQTMQVEGKESVPDVIELMDSYYLTRDDFESIMELGVGPMDQKDVNLDTQTKSSFTRTYNAMSHPLPFMKASSSVLAPKKASKDRPDLEEAIEEEDDDQVVEAAEADEDDELDLKKDKYIKQPKAKKATKKAAKAAENSDMGEDEDDKPTKGKGRGRPKASKGKK